MFIYIVREMTLKAEHENELDHLRQENRILKDNNLALTRMAEDAKLETKGQKELLEALKQEFSAKLSEEETKSKTLREV